MLKWAAGILADRLSSVRLLLSWRNEGIQKVPPRRSWRMRHLCYTLYTVRTLPFWDVTCSVCMEQFNWLLIAYLAGNSRRFMQAHSDYEIYPAFVL